MKTQGTHGLQVHTFISNITTHAHLYIENLTEWWKLAFRTAHIHITHNQHSCLPCRESIGKVGQCRMEYWYLYRPSRDEEMRVADDR